MDQQKYLLQKNLSLMRHVLTCVCPNGEALSLSGQVKDTKGNATAHFTGRVTHCRNCPKINQCMKNPTATTQKNGRGRQVSFQFQKQNKATHTDWMKERVDSDKGKRIYSHRMSVVEPVFGNLEFNKKLTRFSLRGLKKVRAQWKLFCLIQNIEKLANYGKLTT